MRWYKYLVVGLAITAITLTVQTAYAALASSTFDSDTEGWTVQSLYASYGNPPSLVNNYSMVWRSTGGNTNGYAAGTDDNYTMYFSAPEEFLGNKAAAFGGTLSYDLMTESHGLLNLGNPGLILVGAGKTLYYDAFSNPSIIFYKWTSYTISLASSTYWHLNSNGGAAPTEGEMKEILGSLDAIYIYADWVYDYDTTGIDNVAMSTVPIPAAVWFLSTGLIGLAVLRRKTKT
jgi:hypothetical protein